MLRTDEMTVRVFFVGLGFVAKWEDVLCFLLESWVTRVMAAVKHSIFLPDFKDIKFDGSVDFP